MNNKGELKVGTILVVAIALIVGAIFFQVISQQVGSSTNTVTVANETLGDASNSTTVYLTAYKSISNVVIYNESGKAIVPSTNYTLTNNVIDPTTGGLAVSVLPTSAATAGFTGFEWTISGTAQETTYISESGGRAVANLIGIFFALVLVAAALFPIYESKFMEWIGR